MRRHGGLAWVLPIGLWGCGEPEQLPCEEQGGTELRRVLLELGEVELSAEVASTEDERATAWADRLCNLEGLLWVPDDIGPAAIPLCDVRVAVDLAFLRDGDVVAVERERAPCSADCADCPAYGESGPEVDAVLWVVSGSLEIAVGDRVTGLEAVGLPTEASAGATDSGDASSG